MNDKTESFEVPLEPARAEIIVSNSRFIASLDYAASAAEARAFIAKIRGEFPDATHNVPAFIVGAENSRTEFCSDDGEPSGTAGRPLLSVLRGSGLGNIAAVVTRYFGGTLLGTGGLVKAYSEAGKKALALARRAVLVECSALKVDLPYSLFDTVRFLLPEFGADIAAERFGEIVSLDIDIPSRDVERFISKLAELSAGGLSPRIVGGKTERRALRDSEDRRR